MKHDDWIKSIQEGSECNEEWGAVLSSWPQKVRQQQESWSSIIEQGQLCFNNICSKSTTFLAFLFRLLLTIVTVVAMGPSNIITFCVSCFYLAFNAHISNNILDREWHCLLVVQCMVALLLFQLPNQWKKKVSKDIGMCSWERETVKFFPTFSRSIAMKKCNLVVKRLL